MDGKFSGAYTRFIIQSDVYANQKPASKAGAADVPEEIAPLPYEPRNWLARALVGKEFSINLTAKLSVGALEQTVPLVTIGHSSNSDGEKWTRAVHHDVSGFPLFLVKGDGSASVPRIQFSVKAANRYSSRGAAAALGVAVQVAKAVSVTPTVVTRLSAASTKSEAQALDNAISQLFGSALAEEHWSDRDLNKWVVHESGPRGAVVEFSIPETESDFGSKPLKVGWWRITFDAPRPSIFVDWRICDAAKPRCRNSLAAAKAEVVKEISAGEVLNYKLVPANPELATIRAYLASQDWYNAAITAFATQRGKTNELKASADVFCRRVINEMTGLGLNGFDAAAVLWAAYRGMPAEFPDFATAPSCSSGMQDFASKP